MSAKEWKWRSSLRGETCRTHGRGLRIALSGSRSRAQWALRSLATSSSWLRRWLFCGSSLRARLRAGPSLRNISCSCALACSESVPAGSEFDACSRLLRSTLRQLCLPVVWFPIPPDRIEPYSTGDKRAIRDSQLKLSIFSLLRLASNRFCLAEYNTGAD